MVHSGSDCILETKILSHFATTDVQLCSDMNIAVGDSGDVKRTRRYCSHDSCIILLNAETMEQQGHSRSTQYTHILTELLKKSINDFSCDCCYSNQF